MPGCKGEIFTKKAIVTNVVLLRQKAKKGLIKVTKERRTKKQIRMEDGDISKSRKELRVENELTLNLKKKKKRKKWFILFLIGLSLFIIGLLLILNRAQPQPILSGDFPDITAAQQMTDDNLKKYAQDAVDKSNVTINVYPEVEVNSDGKTGRIWVQNLPTNVTGQEAILKDSSGDVLFKSGLIRPGQEIRKLDLLKELDQGTHKGSIEIRFYDLEAEKQVGQTVVDVKINVE